MSRHIYKMKVASVRDLTPTVRELIIENLDAQEFKFRAGQFVMLHVPQGEAKPALRAYSIASTETESNRFRLLFKFLPQGKASEFVWTLKGGELLDFTGPFGKVFFAEPPPQQVLMMCTSTGLAQHLSYLESFLGKYPGTQFHLFMGVQNEAEQFCVAEMQKLKEQHANFEFEVVLSQGSSSWTGKRGYVQHHVHDWDFNAQDTEIYLCGNKGMIDEVKALLTQENFDMQRSHVEAF